MPMTPAALPPELALAYLQALSADLRDGVVADAQGALLAGDPGLLARAAGVDGVAELPGGRLHVARDAAHTVAVLTGPHALDAVVAADLGAVLGDLAGRRRDDSPTR